MRKKNRQFACIAYIAYAMKSKNCLNYLVAVTIYVHLTCITHGINVSYKLQLQTRWMVLNFWKFASTPIPKLLRTSHKITRHKLKYGFINIGYWSRVDGAHFMRVWRANSASSWSWLLVGWDGWFPRTWHNHSRKLSIQWTHQCAQYFSTWPTCYVLVWQVECAIWWSWLLAVKHKICDGKYAMKIFFISRTCSLLDNMRTLHAVRKVTRWAIYDRWKRLRFRGNRDVIGRKHAGGFPTRDEMTAVKGQCHEQINVHNGYEHGPHAMCACGALNLRFEEVHFSR